MYYGQFSAILLSFKKIRIVLNNEKYREDDPKFSFSKIMINTSLLKLLTKYFNFGRIFMNSN